MIVDAQVSWLKQMTFKATHISDAIKYKQDTSRFKVDLRQLNDVEIDKLVAIATKNKGNGYKALEQAVKTYRQMKVNPSGLKINDLKQFESALVEHFLKTENHWLFIEEDGKLLPYFVNNIEHHPERWEGSGDDRHRIPAKVTMTAIAVGDDKSWAWWKADLGDGQLTVPELLRKAGIRTEDDELFVQYTEEMERYAKIAADVGRQYSATGNARSNSDSWYYHTEVSMDREGQRSKVVIDDGSEGDDDEDNRGRRRRRSSKRETVGLDFWLKKQDPNYAAKAANAKKRSSWYDNDDDDDDDVEVKQAALPRHPFIQIFDLITHQFMTIHVNNLEPYKFDKTLGDKLILPKDTLTLLHALVDGAGQMMDDIIEGKTGGTIVIATGPPGTGKTLSAEVFSEIIERPLYVVQCSQLGLDPLSLEKELGKVLQRAQRWGAILLIDEADVYIRMRGKEVLQNAIVGVWLRVLEYYRGVLFLTSNKATIIDDAVISRATAWVRYDIPSTEEQTRIWEMLAKQYEIKMPPELVKQLTARWPKATGRNIKTMLKLYRQLGYANVPKKGMDLFEMCASFLDIPDTKSGRKLAEAAALANEE